MKRYSITNTTTGMKFQVEKDGELVMQPEYGEAPDVVVTDIAGEIQQSKIHQEAMAYLALTDWFALRKADTGEDIPEDVKVKRAKAREAIKKL